MPHSDSVWVKILGTVIAAASLTACLGQTKAPELLAGSETQVTIVADLHSSPKPLAKSHCGQYGTRPLLSDTSPADDNLMRGWATGTKVFIYIYDCR